MEPILYAERGYGAPIKVRTMRLFPSLDEAMQFLVDKEKKKGVHVARDEFGGWVHQFYRCVGPGELLKKIKEKEIQDSPVYKALPKL